MKIVMKKKSTQIAVAVALLSASTAFCIKLMKKAGKRLKEKKK